MTATIVIRPDPKIEDCAAAAHEVNRRYCLALGDTSQVPWEEAPEWQKDSVRKGVAGALAGNTPEQSHECWLAEKRATGWVYGPVKNAGAKEHPCMLPYAALPPEQRAKDSLFLNTVRSMAAALGMTVMYPAGGGLPGRRIDWSKPTDTITAEHIVDAVFQHDMQQRRRPTYSELLAFFNVQPPKDGRDPGGPRRASFGKALEDATARGLLVWTVDGNVIVLDWPPANRPSPHIWDSLDDRLPSDDQVMAIVPSDGSPIDPLDVSGKLIAKRDAPTPPALAEIIIVHVSAAVARLCVDGWLRRVVGGVALMTTPESEAAIAKACPPVVAVEKPYVTYTWGVDWLTTLDATPADLDPNSFLAARAALAPDTAEALIVPPSLSERAEAVVSDIDSPAFRCAQVAVEPSLDSPGPRRWYVAGRMGAVAREMPDKARTAPTEAECRQMVTDIRAVHVVGENPTYFTLIAASEALADNGVDADRMVVAPQAQMSAKAILAAQGYAGPPLRVIVADWLADRPKEWLVLAAP